MMDDEQRELFESLHHGLPTAEERILAGATLHAMAAGAARGLVDTSDGNSFVTEQEARVVELFLDGLKLGVAMAQVNADLAYSGASTGTSVEKRALMMMLAHEIIEDNGSTRVAVDAAIEATSGALQEGESAVEAVAELLNQAFDESD